MQRRSRNRMGANGRRVSKRVKVVGKPIDWNHEKALKTGVK